MLFKCWDVNLGCDFDPFWENLTCIFLRDILENLYRTMEKYINLDFPWKIVKKILNRIWQVNISCFTGQVFSKRIKITPQSQIQKLEEHRVLGWVPCWGSILTSTVFALTKRTLWMLEMTPSKAPVLKLHVLQIFICEFGEWFWSFLRKLDL